MSVEVPFDSLQNMVLGSELNNQNASVVALRARLLTALTSLGLTPSSAPAITIVTKALDQAVTNSIVLVNDNELFQPLAANEKRFFNFYLFAQAATGTPDIRISLTAPLLATGLWWTNSAQVLSSLVAVPKTLFDGIVISQEQIVGGATGVIVFVRGRIVNGVNAGNLQLQWAQLTANANPTNVLAGSFLISESF